jgi:hypothetical protein
MLFFHSYHQSNHNRPCLYHLKNETEPFAAMTEYRLPQRVGFFLRNFDKHNTRKYALISSHTSADVENTSDLKIFKF